MMSAVDSRNSTATRTRHRSSSDPFSDPRANIHRAPDPPPKQHYRMASAAAATRPRDNIADAVRDTVTVSPRRPPNRSQTTSVHFLSHFVTSLSYTSYRLVYPPSLRCLNQRDNVPTPKTLSPMLQTLSNVQRPRTVVPRKPPSTLMLSTDSISQVSVPVCFIFFHYSYPPI
jgi:hypothetical protein